jgi:3-dehydroquinate synthase
MVDENTLQNCFPKLIEEIPAIKPAEIIEIESGEINKNTDICVNIWEALSDLGAERNSVIINLGGGVITDMGGFIASTFKRGMRFIHIPTTLLSQVDASVGGKVGIDLKGIKNLVGCFSNPEAVFIDPRFLITLPKKEILSGFAEIIKHALVADAVYWKTLKEINLAEPGQLETIIYRSIEIKNNIVQQDPMESGLRKVLNFGHTVGHAVESLSLEGGRKQLTHGEAVAIGMICESWLSWKNKSLPEEEFNEIISFIQEYFPPWPFDDMDFHRLIALMRNDKKNRDNTILFTLLEKTGKATWDCALQANDIKDSLKFYLSLDKK